MPTYSYECVKCHNKTDERGPYHDYGTMHPTQRCEKKKLFGKCGGQLKRVMETGSNVSFQGLPTEKHYK